MLRLAIVTDNQDPDNLRRVRVCSSDRGVSVSDWIIRITGYCDEDSPVPPIGSTVIIGKLEGGSADEVVLGVLQSTTSNPPLTKTSLSDTVQIRYGNHLESNTGDWQSVSESVLIQTTRGHQVQIGTDGLITIANSNGSIQLDPNGEVVILSPMLTWNGERVAVVGGTDSDGDTTLR